MKIFDNVKSLEFRVRLNGDGCVNYDSKEQMYTLANNGYRKGSGIFNENVKYAKKRFNSDNTFSYKQSSDCIKHEMYKDCMEFMNTRLSYIPMVLYRALAQSSYLMRGWVFTDGAKISRKSCVTITDSVSDIKHNYVDMEVHSTSGAKGEKPKDKDDKGNTSLFFEENVGKEQYSFDGYIDLTEIQFISLDPVFDRLNVDVDGGENEEIFLTALKENFGDDIKIDYYYIKSSITEDEFAERGILLNRDAVDSMVKDTLKRIMNINIWRSNSYLKYDSITVYVNYNNGTREEIPIDNIEDLSNYYFNYFEKYQVADIEKIMNNKRIYEELKEKYNSKRKADKESQSKSKKSKNEVTE